MVTISHLASRFVDLWRGGCEFVKLLRALKQRQRRFIKPQGNQGCSPMQFLGGGRST